MTPIEAIDAIEKNCAIHVGNVVLADEAWQTLKTAVLAQQTTNSKSAPCPNCGERAGRYSLGEACMVCHYNL
jgi:hypothetical protein